MLLKRLTVGLIAATLFVPMGCRKEKSDKRLIEIAVRQERQEGEVSRIARRIQGIEHELGQILASARTGAQASEADKALPRQAVGLEETPEYLQLAAEISDIQQELNLTQSDFLQTKEHEELQRRTDPVQQMMALRNPAEMTKRLDALAETFGPKIDDAVRRQEFQAQVEQLKRINAANLSREELYDRVVWCLRQSIDTEQHEDTRGHTEYHLRELVSPPDGDLDAALSEARRWANFNRLGRIILTYGVPAEATNDAGLPRVSGLHIKMGGPSF